VKDTLEMIAKFVRVEHSSTKVWTVLVRDNDALKCRVRIASGVKKYVVSEVLRMYGVRLK